MKLLYKINLIRSQVTRHLTLVLGGNIFAAGLGFLTILIISRELTVAEFGMFIIVISLMRMIPDFSSFGLDTSMVKFASAYLASGKTREASQITTVTFYSILFINIVIAIIIFFITERLSVYNHNDSSMTSLFKISAFGILAIGMLNYFKSAFYAHKLFTRVTTIQFLIDLTKFISIFCLVLISVLRPNLAIIVYVIVPFFGAIYGFIKIHKKLRLPKIMEYKHDVQILFSFSKWFFLSNSCGIIYYYVGLFMVAKILGNEAAGTYGLAFNLTMIFPIINASIMSVLLPEVARFKDESEFKHYLKTALKILFYFGLFVIPILIFSNRIVPFFFGFRYVDSVPILNWLILGHIVNMIFISVRVILLSINKPHILFMVNLLKLVIMICGCFFLIPIFSVTLPAILLLILNICSLIYLLIYLSKEFKNGKISFKTIKSAKDSVLPNC